jgi:hypothetical protein
MFTLSCKSGRCGIELEFRKVKGGRRDGVGGSGIEKRFEISKWETSVEEDEAKKFCTR